MKIENELIKLFKTWNNADPSSISPLPVSGSARKYFRLTYNDSGVIGVYGPEPKENKAFLYFSKFFKSTGLNVPEIYAENPAANIYLIEDLGDVTLFKLLQKDFEEAKKYYQNVINDLISFQLSGEKIDYSYCYPREKFDRQSMQWDLNYFKYYFLKPLNIFYDEQKLEDDFNTLINFLSEADSFYFLYRDYQTRNIIIKNQELFYVDYQGGRNGALQYDLASLLFDAKANLNENFRDELLQLYLENISKKIELDEVEFKKYFYEFVLIRILQAMGAYGFRGIYEGKPHFLQSIPFALKNVEWLLKENKIRLKLPELFSAINQLFVNAELRKIGSGGPTVSSKLKVTINSFSYRDKIPADYSGNGGGFVFDCRGIENPGRQERFKNLTGLDKPVQDFIEKETSANQFLKNVFELTDRTIKTYLERNFTSLQINFGCTGGQHRSVYCAYKLAEYLKKNFDVDIEVNHLSLENKLSGI